MKDDNFNQKLKTGLKQWDEPLPPSIAGRLRAARYDAIEDKAPVFQKRRRYLPGAMMMTAATVALLVVGMKGMQSTSPEMTNTVDDVVLLTGGDEFDMLENVDFLLWLAEQDEAELG